MISGNGTAVNNTVAPSINQVTLLVHGMAANRRYTISIAAINDLGAGPFSTPLEMELDPVLFYPYPHPGYPNQASQWTLIIVIISILLLVIICLAAMFIYRKRIFERTSKPQGYLEAASTDDFHHCQLARKIDENLWIDRRWNTGDYSREEVEEKESNSSEKKLLPPQHSNSNSNSDTEYTYVDGIHKQALNVSSFTASSGSGKSRKSTNSPEPYATTDIFRSNGQLNHFQGNNNNPKSNCYSSSSRNQAHEMHYAAPIMNYKRTANNHKSCDYIPNKSIAKGSAAAMSCDDLSRPGGKRQDQRKRPNKNYLQQQQRQANPNIMDILPPPPSCPPPNSHSVYAESQESVISPKYLFQHPVYQSANRHIEHNSSRRVYPSSRYEEIPQSHGVGFTRVIPEGIPVATPSNDQRHKKSIEEFERHLASELQIFNEAITKFSTTPKTTRRSDTLPLESTIDDDIDNDNVSSCDADQEDNLSIATSELYQKRQQ